MRVLNLRRLAGFGCIALLGLGAFAVSGAEDPVLAQEEWGTCGCYGGSDPEGPEEQYGDCFEYLYSQCSSWDECDGACGN